MASSSLPEEFWQELEPLLPPDEEPGEQGPRRVSRKELHAAFAEGWGIESIEPARAGADPKCSQGAPAPY